MANSIKGEVAFKAGGQDYVAVFSVNALVALEDELGDGVADIAAALGDGKVKFRTLRTVFWAALQDKQPEIDQVAAGSIMTALGVAEATAIVGEAFAAAFPDAKGTEDGTASAGPQPAAGTGSGS